MAKHNVKVATIDPIWLRLVAEAEYAIMQEPLLGGLMHACVLHHASIQDALVYRLSLIHI